MATSSVSATGSSQTTGGSQGTAATTTASGLQDQFMQILLTQLRYQDPMEPMEEKDFFAQMAQFTSATQIGNLNTKMDQVLQSMSQTQISQSLLSAAKLIGSSFSAETSDGIVQGVVDSVALSEGKVIVKSGDMQVPVENLLAIGGTVNAG